LHYVGIIGRFEPVGFGGLEMNAWTSIEASWIAEKNVKKKVRTDFFSRQKS